VYTNDHESIADPSSHHPISLFIHTPTHIFTYTPHNTHHSATMTTPPPPPRPSIGQADVDATLSIFNASCGGRDLLLEAEGKTTYTTTTPDKHTHTHTSSSSPIIKCRPWSEADYFQRLRTFSPQTWFGKSLAVSPPRCAASGWVNVEMDTLRCEMYVSILQVKWLCMAYT
jgi:hypothetical protein